MTTTAGKKKRNVRPVTERRDGTWMKGKGDISPENHGTQVHIPDVLELQIKKTRSRNKFEVSKSALELGMAPSLHQDFNLYLRHPNAGGREKAETPVGEDAQEPGNSSSTDMSETPSGLIDGSSSVSQTSPKRTNHVGEPAPR